MQQVRTHERDAGAFTGTIEEQILIFDQLAIKGSRMRDSISLNISRLYALYMPQI